MTSSSGWRMSSTGCSEWGTPRAEARGVFAWVQLEICWGLAAASRGSRSPNLGNRNLGTVNAHGRLNSHADRYSNRVASVSATQCFECCIHSNGTTTSGTLRIRYGHGHSTCIGTAVNSNIHRVVRSVRSNSNSSTRSGGTVTVSPYTVRRIVTGNISTNNAHCASTDLNGRILSTSSKGTAVDNSCPLACQVETDALGVDGHIVQVPHVGLAVAAV